MRRYWTTGLLLLLWSVPGLPVGAQPVSEGCSEELIELEAGVTTTSSVTIDGDEVPTLAFVEVGVDISMTWVSSLDPLNVVSPLGTTVTLHEGEGGFSSNIDATYSMVGRPNDSSVSVPGSGPSPWACDGCRWQDSAEDPTALSDFVGEDPVGDWQLDVTVAPEFGDGQLHEWCVTVWDVAPALDLACTRNDEDDPDTEDIDESVGHVSITFTAGSSYTSVVITNYTDEVAIVDDDFFEGDSYTLTVGPLARPQIASLEVTGIVDDIASLGVRCDVPLLADPVECLAGSEGDLGPELSTYIDIVEFESTDVLVNDMTVSLDITYSFIGDLEILLASPSDTAITLHRDVSPADPTDLLATYWQLGAAPLSVSYNEGNMIQPSGPGAFADFNGLTTANDDGVSAWALAVSDAFDDGTVNAWELCVYDVAPAFAPTGLSCEEGDELGTVAASALAEAAYTRVRWFVNGVVAEDSEFDPPLEIGDGVSFVSVPQPLPSVVRVAVQGFVGPEDDRAPGPLTECSLRVSLPPPADMTCSAVSGEFEVTASWSIPDELPADAYDSYDVFVDGEFIEVLADGSLTSYTTDIGLDADTSHTVSIVGVLDDPPARSDAATCRTLVLSETDVEECVVDAIEAPSGTASSTVTVEDTGTVQSIEVFMEGSSSFLANEDHFLGHVESGTELTLHDTFGPTAQSDYCMLWTDTGEALTALTDLTACGSIQPQGAGGFAVFTDQVSDGDWVLTVTNSTFAFEVDAWCLRMDICEVTPPAAFETTTVGDDLELDWVNEGEYDEIRVYDEDELLEVLAGDADSATLEDLDPGRYRIVVAGYSEEFDCESRSAVARVLFGAEESCIPDLEVDPGGTLDPTVLGFEFPSMVVGDVEVLLDLDTTFVSEWDVFVVSPSATRVQLHDNQGGGGAFRVVWSNRVGAEPVPNGLPFDCNLCAMEPSPGNLASFVSEASEGTWDLELVAPVFATTLNEACLAIYAGCPADPPSAVVADVVGNDIVVTWDNNPETGEYSSLRVERNGELLAEGLAPDEVEYVDESPQSGFYTYRIIAAVDDPDAEEPCVAASLPSAELAKGILLECSPDTPVTVGDDEVVVAEIEVVDDPRPDEIQVLVDVAIVFVPDLSIELVSPDEERVRLYAGSTAGNGINDNMNTVFADGGEPQPAFDYDAGAHVAPAGPGELLDVLDGSITGTWSLEVDSSPGFADGVLEDYCLQFLVGCPLDRPTIESCLTLDGGNLPPVELSFSGIDPDDVDEIQILRNGEIIEILSSDSTSYIDEDVTSSGRQTYRVAAYSAELNCARPSLPCASVPLGRFETCVEPGAEITDDRLLVISTVEFEYADEDGDPPKFETDGDADIDTIEVSVDITTGFTGNNDIWIYGPDVTTVMLNATNGGALPGLKVTFSAAAAGPMLVGPPRDPLCECLVLPQGPGSMADFAGKDAEGEWTLAISAREEGTLHEWCLAVFPAVLPVTDDGGIHFLRGDADNNGSVSAIPDGLRILNWGSGNADAPPCLVSADVDGSGTVSAIPDGLRLLNWGSGNALPPPAPFPECGVDPTDEDLEDSEACDTDGDGTNDGGGGCMGDPTL